MEDDELYGVFQTIKELEQLKNITRTAWTQTGRKESTAEHSWRVALFILLIKESFPTLNSSKAITMALIHDLGEAYTGDISATLMPDTTEKLDQEQINLEKLLSQLNTRTKNELLDLINEYNAGTTLESKLVKALDKMETIIQHNQGDNPETFNYAFNLTYGKSLTEFSSILRRLRKLVDAETIERLSE